MNPARPNGIVRDLPLRGELAYLYGLKARARRHHCIGHGTFSVAADRLGELRRRYSYQVRPITYLPIYIKALARAIEANPIANTILFRKPGGLKIVQFERVDVNLPIRRRIGDRWITFIGAIRGAAGRTLLEIEDELVHYQRASVQTLPAVQRFLQFDGMPLWLAQLVHWRMTWSPRFYANQVGTCGITFLDGDWYENVFPIGPTTAILGIGGMHREPVVDGDAIVIGRRLHCCLMGDNYVLSGPAGAAVARSFKTELETGRVVTDEIGEQS